MWESNERITLLYDNLSGKWRPNVHCAGFRPRFPLDQTFRFESPEIATTRAKHFAEFPSKRTTSRGLPKFETISSGNFRSIWFFQPGIFVVIVSISKIQLISGFPETFPRSKSSRIFWLNEKRSLSTGPGSSPDQDYYIVFFILTVPLSTVPWCLNGFQRM